MKALGTLGWFLLATVAFLLAWPWIKAQVAVNFTGKVKS